jgi:hypothetical protein
VHYACHPGGGMFVRLVWLLMRMLTYMGVIHVVLVFAAAKPNVFGVFMQKLFKSDYLVDAGAGGIERQSASPRIGHHYVGRALPSYINVIDFGPGI